MEYWQLYVIGAGAATIYLAVAVWMFQILYEGERGKDLALYATLAAFWPFCGPFIAISVGLAALVATPVRLKREYQYGRKVKVSLRERDDLAFYLDNKSEFKLWLKARRSSK